ncbi:serine/threonine phosphatase [Thermoleptolyngbya sp. PKUAC-SCTB121]|uniref:serine/threonine phosphatase n=1 Tax=Thermoleptolyngbya sp. PKUAC-SCTB121 TaxID=2811482 RepID=UPI0019629619|nr:serine/threonine phosphatase [Thermoleptolyngbya sp. PKUAC-SCTB121]
MLVCPQCEFENPDSNKFCQQCGASLQEIACPACGSSVPFDVELCPTCGATAGTSWRAIIAAVDAAVGWPLVLPALPYLDLQHRYRLLEALSATSLSLVGAEVRVLDCQPFRLSPLEMLYSQNPDAPDAGLARSDEAIAQSSKNTIPAIAQTYLDLQQQLYPSLPHIHDAWEKDGQIVVLLEDRSSLPSLAELGASEVLPPFQILHLLHQMTELWNALQPVGYAQSLLELNNLKVDEDQLLYLQRLYQDKPDASPQLRDLGRVWKLLLQQQPSHENLNPLVQVCQDLELGTIATVDVLQHCLSMIADLLQGEQELPDAGAIALDATTEAIALDKPEAADETAPDLQAPDLQADDIQAEDTIVLPPALSAKDTAPADAASANHPNRPLDPTAVLLGGVTASLLDTAPPKSATDEPITGERIPSELITGEPVTDEPITAELVASEPAAEPAAMEAEPITAESAAANPAPAPATNSEALPMSDSAESETTEILFPTVSRMADISVSSSPTRLELGSPDEDSETEGDDLPTVVLPMKLIGLEDAGRSDIGRQREHNEDYYAIQVDVKKLESQNGRSLKAKGLYILCDGMGGHASGEVASALAASTLQQYFQDHWKDGLPSEATIRDGILLANKAIYTLNQENASSGSGRMGTTLVLALIQDTEAAIAHVGDSRLYRYSRRRGLEQLTVDHEVGQREIQRGVEPAIAYGRPDAYQLTQALGPRDEHFVNPDVQFVELTEDLLLLLCSDGLTDNDLLETHVESHLDPMLDGQVSLDNGVNMLIDLANQHNGHDNITAIAIHARVRPNLDLMKRG